MVKENSVCVSQKPLSYQERLKLVLWNEKLQCRINRRRMGMGGPADLLTDESFVESASCQV